MGRQWPDDGVRVFTLARSDGPVTCAKGLRVLPDKTWETAPPLDVLVYPGGRGTRAELRDEAVLDWIRGLSGSGTVVASVCTGSLVLAAAGLLDGRPATTHWQSLELLPTLGSEIEVRPDDRFVDNGNVITAAGRLGRDRHGSAPGCAAAFTGARPRGAALHPVRPRTAGVSSRRTAPADITAAVIASFERSEDERLRTLAQSLARHLHAFATEVGLTQREWEEGIRILTETGDITDDPAAGVHPLVGHARPLDGRRRAR